MAALVKHVVLRRIDGNIFALSASAGFLMQQRSYRAQNAAKRNKVKPKKREKVPIPETRKLKSVGDSLATRGFLRCQEDYDPPEDLIEQLEASFSSVVGQPPSDNAVIPKASKFALLETCFTIFKHGVPNSILHRVNTYGDLKEFYLTPVNTTLPLEKMATADLPPNLHIQVDPIRFHPDDDKMFNGQTAFPKSSTIVTGLRSRRKYKGHSQTDIWPLKY